MKSDSEGRLEIIFSSPSPGSRQNILELEWRFIKGNYIPIEGITYSEVYVTESVKTQHNCAVSNSSLLSTKQNNML